MECQETIDCQIEDCSNPPAPGLHICLDCMQAANPKPKVGDTITYAEAIDNDDSRKIDEHARNLLSQMSKKIIEGIDRDIMNGDVDGVSITAGDAAAAEIESEELHVGVDLGTDKDEATIVTMQGDKIVDIERGAAAEQRVSIATEMLRETGEGVQVDIEHAPNPKGNDFEPPPGIGGFDSLYGETVRVWQTDQDPREGIVGVMLGMFAAPEYLAPVCMVLRCTQEDSKGNDKTVDVYLNMNHITAIEIEEGD